MWDTLNFTFKYKNRLIHSSIKNNSVKWIILNIKLSMLSVSKMGYNSCGKMCPQRVQMPFSKNLPLTIAPVYDQHQGAAAKVYLKYAYTLN